MSARRESRLRGLLVNLATAAVAFVLVCGALELLARFWRGRPAEPVASLYTEFDPLLGWRHKKGAKVSFPQGDYGINSLGLRDQERGYDAAAGAVRLMVLGDSFAEGFSVPFDSSVAHVLESRLRSACPAEVIAAGTVGYSTDQEYLYYREEGARYSPRLLLLFFYYNDIVYNAREAVGRAPKPLLTFKGGTPRVKTSPLLEPARPGAAEGAPSGSAALAWAAERLLSGAPRVYDLLARLRLWPPRGPLRAGAELLVYSRDPPSEVKDAWAQTVNVLRALRDEAAAHAARIVVVYVPSKMEVSDADWELTKLRYGVDERTWDRGQVARWLIGAGHALEVPVLDLTAALRRQQRGTRAAYHARGGHWNAVGHATAALEVEGFLRQSGLLPDCAPR
jgi:hypothetical protein